MADTPTAGARLDAEATLFGFDPVPVQVWVLARSKGWRVGGAAGIMGAFVVIAPVAAIFPPHAVWPIGALLTGAALARRRYIERHTLQALEGSCPKCGKAFAVKPGRLSDPHHLPCDGCHHSAILRFPPGSLPEPS